VHLMALHALEPHPDVSLDVLHVYPFSKATMSICLWCMSA